MFPGLVHEYLIEQALRRQAMTDTEYYRMRREEDQGLTPAWRWQRPAFLERLARLPRRGQSRQLQRECQTNAPTCASERVTR